MLLLAPTRELAEQIHRETERLSAGRRFRLGIVKKNLASSSALDGQVSLAHLDCPVCVWRRYRFTITNLLMLSVYFFL